MICDEALRDYANLLYANGFAIYEAGPTWDYFTYSRVVDGVELFGIVSKGYFGGYSHTMPIRPSREHGSSMWVAGVPDSTPDQGNRLGDPLTVEAATTVASPTNRNPLVGLQRNYGERWGGHGTRWPDADKVAAMEANELPEAGI